MTALYKFSLKKRCFPVLAIAFCIAITWKTEARRTPGSEIYSTLTSDTIPAGKKDTIPVTAIDTIPANAITDSSILSDSIVSIPVVDTFPIKFSKDTLDAPIEYEAIDSGVLLVKEKKFLLYGRTKTVYKKNTLVAPRVELDQETNIVTAFNAKDSLGNTTSRAKFDDGTQSFSSDTIQFNMKSQQGLTKNTYTQPQGELSVHADLIKKVNDQITFAKRLTMTTCEYDHPHFGFVASKGKFVNEKIAVTGPVHPEFEGVPVPIYL